MIERRGINLLEVIVVIFAIFFIFIVLDIIGTYTKGRNSFLARRVVCGTNLKGLGTAMAVYANDYEDQFPKLGVDSSWSKELGFNYYDEFDSAGEIRDKKATVSASLYLLVREVDVSPKSFVCPNDTERKAFEGENPRDLDLVEMWDFGAEPQKHVSYSYHLPYSEHAATGAASASFAVMADMSPWFKDGDIVKPSEKTKKGWESEVVLLLEHWVEGSKVKKYDILRANSMNHGREGQNVTFGDGHASYEKYSDVGVKHDNIYTYQPQGKEATEKDIRIGINPTARDDRNKPANDNDSFLVF